ncbi:MAG TPA: cytochrome P450 [Candidatus Baltobacteraceae bacterium]|nr:cytochrome P450 [Candidatus Baltobacteraceae bacterium]
MREPPGPGMWETYRRLRATPLPEFPRFLNELERQYGSVAAFRVPWRRFYFVNDPAAIKDVLVTQQQAFVKSEGTRAMRELLGEGLVTSEEPLHRRMRRIVQPAFHRERIVAYAQTMREYAQAWRPPSGVFDMHAEMMELTLRIASKTLFGVDAGAQADRVGAALHEVVTIFPDVLGPFGAIKRRLPFPATVRFRKARRVLDEIVLGLIAQRRKAGESSDNARNDRSALSMLLTARDEQTGQGLSDAQVRDEVMTLFVAGHETTANALTWTWYLLSKHPRVRERLCDELRRDPQSPYLDAVLSETLRLYPPAWILGRDALREVDVQGWRFRKGATVFVSQLVMHRSPRYFSDPEHFQPDRWLPAPSLPQFAYFPFGGGARKCLGDQFAWTEARIELAHLAQRWRFELDRPEREVQPDPIITLRPQGSVLMRAVPVTFAAFS